MHDRSGIALNKGEKGAEDDGLISRQGTKAIN